MQAQVTSILYWVVIEHLGILHIGQEPRPRLFAETQRLEVVFPNRLRKCRRLKHCHVNGIIVGLSVMSFENCHNLQAQNVFKKVVLSGYLAWQKLMAPQCFDVTKDQVWTIHFSVLK